MTDYLFSRGGGSDHLSRRKFLATSAALAAATAAGRAAAAQEAAPPIGFFVVGDTHYFAQKEQPEVLDERSAAINGRLVDTLNSLPGAMIPDEAGGGAVVAPRGVVHVGDLIDSGDKNGHIYEQMQRTEWRAYTADYGLTGSDGRLNYPVYEVHGNHDSPGGRGLAIDGIVERNRRRPGLKHVSANGLHCSWDWGPIHFVNLGIVVGQVEHVAQRRRYNPLDSLDFLIADLEQHVGRSGRPVVLTHHIDIARYTGPCDPEEPTNLGKEWNPCDVRGYYQAIKDYQVLAILHGHTHARHVLTWDGDSARAEQGLTVFNVDNSGHFGSDLQAFLYFEIADREMTVRECATSDGWISHRWTPQVWRRPVAG